MGYRTTKSKIKVESSKINNYTDFYYHFFRNILVASLPLLVISALILSIPHSSAEGSVPGGTTRVDSVTLNLPVSCTISATELTPHVATFEGSGLHREDIGTTKVGVFCNDNNGYNIYAVGNSNNVDGNTDLVVSGLSSDYNIKTGIYSSGSTVSSWGMKITPGTGTGSESERTPPTANNGYNNYNVIPSTYTMVASRASGTNMNPNVDLDITGSYFTTTYDIYASSAQPAGTYTGKVKYILTHPNANAPSTLNSIDGAFASAGKQKAYQDSEGSYYAMQDMTSDICNSVIGTGESTTAKLVDIRDKNLYYVTKLADGHCWMTQNLDLDLDPAKPLTSDNTDLTDHSLAGAYADSYNYDLNTGITTWTPKNATRNYQSSTGTAWSNSNNIAYSLDPGEWYWDSYNDDNIVCNYLNTTCDHFSQIPYNTNGAHGHVGNYYNWSAAIASNNSSSLTSDMINDTQNNPQNSICPKGWRLPTVSMQTNTISGSTNEFSRLNLLYNNNDATNTDVGWVSQPLWFVRAGRYHSNAIDLSNSNAIYWSSIVRHREYAGYLSFKQNNIDPIGAVNGLNDRYLGYSVRCLAR